MIKKRKYKSKNQCLYRDFDYYIKNLKSEIVSYMVYLIIILQNLKTEIIASIVVLIIILKEKTVLYRKSGNSIKTKISITS